IKRAEDGNGLIVRLYESHRKRGRVILKSFINIHSAFETNLLEENEHACEIIDFKIHLDIKPFEIKTIRVHFG
ncbi:MAG: glycosyl hydrolase-related protein, partial [Anaerolineaceae bacterium]|nr:glycosyl hydrolase-related protein [Anaerolineaceae bacterium]